MFTKLLTQNVSQLKIQRVKKISIKNGDYYKESDSIEDFVNKIKEFTESEELYKNLLEKLKINYWMSPTKDYLSATPFGFYPLSFNHKKMFIMEKPGRGQIYIYEIKKEISSYKEWKNNGIDFIKANQNSLVSWLLTGNPYLRLVFYYLSKFQIIDKEITDMNSYMEYIQNDILQDFYITDSWKYRVKSKEMKLPSDQIEKIKEMNKSWLKLEVDKVCPQLILSIGASALKSIKSLYKITSLSHSDSSRKISDMQGHLFICERKGSQKTCLFLPLSHFSSNNAIRFKIFKNLRETMKFLEANKFKEIKKYLT